jgi:hypothetical protein
MSSKGDAGIKNAIKAVRKAYDDLQALRTSPNLMIPLSLLVANTALKRLLCGLNLLAESSDARTQFDAVALGATSITARTWLSDALVHDIQAIARHFRCMTPTDPAEIMLTLNELECRNIAEMVDRYDRTIFSALIQHNECVQDKA